MTRNNQKNKSFYSDPDLIADGILSSSYIFDPGHKDFSGGEYTLFYWRDGFYHWQDGCYIAVSDPEMKLLVVKHIQSLNNNSFEDYEKIKISTQLINNVLLCIKGRVGMSEQRELNSWPDGRESLIQTFSVENGLVMMDYKKPKPLLIAHTPKYFSLVKLPYGYNPKAKGLVWNKFLDEVMQGSKPYILLLQQWAGYLLTPDLRQQKFLLCTGEGSNGKGVFFELMQSLVGKGNCSQVPLTRFSNPFALYSTYGKMVNATNESSHIIEQEAESILKAFVAGDRFTFERKFKEPIYAVPTAKIMISTNALPRFNDKTQGIWRRILLVPFDHVVSENKEVKDLAKKLKRGLPGILNWAIEGWHRLIQAGGFVFPESNKQLIEEYRRDSDPARDFLLENYEVVLDGYGVSCEQIYEEYTGYCQQNGYRPMGNRIFGQQIRRIFSNVKRTKPGSGKGRKWVYEGIASQES